MMSARLGFEAEAIERAQPVDFGDGVRAPVARADDLIVYKTVMWRDLDRQDVERLLLKHGTTIDLDRIRARVAEFARLLESPERLDEFDALIARVRRPHS